MKLVDTSSWIEYLRERQSPTGDNVETLFVKGEAAWCDIILVELWHGVRGAREKKDLADMEKEIENIPIDPAVWKLAQKLALRCREKGFTVPVTDLVIAACSTAHGLDLEHCDKHFHDILPLARSLAGS